MLTTKSPPRSPLDLPILGDLPDDPENYRREFHRRVFALIEPEPMSGCWLWIGVRDRLGYGRRRFRGRLVMAHRVVWELEKSAVPPGMTLDHLCRNRSCVNPQHLQPVPHAVNVARGETGKYNRQKTACPLGHLYTMDNTRIDRGSRRCRTCDRASMRRSYWKRKLGP